MTPRRENAELLSVLASSGLATMARKVKMPSWERCAGFHGSVNSRVWPDSMRSSSMCWTAPEASRMGSHGAAGAAAAPGRYSTTHPTLSARLPPLLCSRTLTTKSPPAAGSNHKSGETQVHGGAVRVVVVLLARLRIPPRDHHIGECLGGLQRKLEAAAAVSARHHDRQGGHPFERRAGWRDGGGRRACRCG